MPTRPAVPRASGGAAGTADGRRRLARRRAAVLAQIDAMRARGMSDTAIRRALGLSERQAVEAGIIPRRADLGHDTAPPAANPPAATADAARQRTGGRGRGASGPLMVEVLTAVAQAGGLSRDEIIGAGQGRRLTRLRQLTMYLLRELCVGASLPAIGHFLHRDHTTVHYGCRMAERQLRGDADFRRLYETLRISLMQRGSPAGG